MVTSSSTNAVSGARSRSPRCGAVDRCCRAPLLPARPRPVDARLPPPAVVRLLPARVPLRLLRLVGALRARALAAVRLRPPVRLRLVEPPERFLRVVALARELLRAPFLDEELFLDFRLIFASKSLHVAGARRAR